MRLGLALPLLLVGCLPFIGDGRPDIGIDCDAMAYPSVELFVVDPEGNTIEDAEAEIVGDGPCEDWPSGHFMCGWERSGELTIRADALGFEAKEATVEVPQGECHVQTQSLTIELDYVLCDDGIRHGVMVEPVDADGNPVAARVEWKAVEDPLGGSPNPCEDYDQIHACAEETGGEIEIWATSREHGSFYDVVDVPIDDCGPVTQSIRAVVDRDPG